MKRDRNKRGHEDRQMFFAPKTTNIQQQTAGGFLLLFASSLLACVACQAGRCFVRVCFMDADWRRGSTHPRQSFSRTVDMHENGVCFPGVFGNDRQTGERLLTFLVVFPGFVRGEPVSRREKPLFWLFFRVSAG